MKATSITSKNILVSLLSSFIITNALFFVDEGFNDFRWMQNWGNWIVFMIYLITLLISQLLILFIFRKRMNNSNLYLISIPIGSLFGLCILFYLFTSS